MKLLFQSDDFGITEGVTLGILKAIRNGLVRNTGLFVNTEASEFAASQIKNYPECCFGLDINLVAGYPVSDPKNIPSLVDKNGKFISSVERFKKGIIKDSNNEKTQIDFEEEPYKFEEVYTEMKNQVEKFIKLVGRKPEYIHPHSLVTPVTIRSFRKIAKEYDLKFSMDILEKNNFYHVPGDWNIKPLFKVEDQLVTDVEENVIKEVPDMLTNDLAVLICHCGYIDDKLLKLSTYSLIRAKDLEMATSEKLINLLNENNVELITYRDLN
ncbi:ChbG/HpnK family deacetylase [Helcococcus kunzii]|uniref:ChbG/HpnK family deacetylase n=1 Tax=Helcococcus kunzii ATCC 51366 TaxID=883114 RepID=H3NQH0_9FIRM|nr:ChbG/HpnK family deacetylase [Helcococcus kunzii]EHR32300.1 hypothetical protein HMPREF9709_01581 [Helcococcus kunzii ATCC 51366]